MDRIPDPLAHIADIDPGRPFVIAPEGAVTYGEADRCVQFATEALRRAGLRRGDRLALHQPAGATGTEEVLRDILLLLAGWRCGVTMVPLSGRLPPASVPGLLERIGGAHVVGVDVPPAEELLAGHTAVDAIPDWHLHEPATIVYTSGSTGEPKAALHSIGNHVWSARGWIERISISPEDRWLLDLPINHVAGLAVLFRCLLAGAAVVVPARSTPIEETVPLLGVTCISMVSTQLRRALESGVAMERLKMVLLGGSSFPGEMLREADARGWPIIMSYGLTEMASTVSATRFERSADIAGTAGTVLPFRKVELAKDGEILVRGRTRFLGYLSPDGLSAPFDEKGWFATGDLGEWVDTEVGSMLRIMGRKDNRFVSGGENIQPEAIEAALLGFSGVRQAVVVPVPSDEFGERPVAFVEADAWAPRLWEAGIAAAMPRFMVPDRFIPWPQDFGTDCKPRREALARLA
jgi:o-succinylbenzoate---CoA ligase